MQMKRPNATNCANVMPSGGCMVSEWLKIAVIGNTGKILIRKATLGIASLERGNLGASVSPKSCGRDLIEPARC